MFALLSNMPGAKPYQSTYTFTPEANPFASYSQAGACCRALACVQHGSVTVHRLMPGPTLLHVHILPAVS